MKMMEILIMKHLNLEIVKLTLMKRG